MITLEHAAEISRDKLSTLNEAFRIRAIAWYEQCLHGGIRVYIYEGLRSNERQELLYNQGRTTNGSIVTNAKAGQSFHNYGFALDWVPLVAAPKAYGLFEPSWDDVENYAAGQNVAKAFDMRSISWETPHLEDSHFATWRDLAQKFQTQS
jgi:peptidoglycan L-alanyl-D-glutamate endopeptidase CwlK